MNRDSMDVLAGDLARGRQDVRRPAARFLTRPMVRIGHVVFRVRNVVFPVVFVALAVAARPRLAGGDERLDHLVDAAGVLLILSGQTLRAAAVGFAYIKRGGKDKRIYADSLVQEGIFAHCRNPLYVGNVLTVIGFSVIHNSPWFYVVGVGFFLFAYLCLVLAEEDFLRERFGWQYEDYCRRVPRFVPSLRGLGKTLGGMTFNWRKLIRKEYGTAFTWITAVLALLAWQAVANFGYEARRGELTVLGIVWLPVAVGYLAARILKKAGALGRG